MAPKKSQTTAEIALVQLKTCLVNLPSTLVAILDNSGTAAQNVIIELQFRGSSTGKRASSTEQAQQSVYVGWSGMVSQRRQPAAPTPAGRPGSRDRDFGAIEIDMTFARTLGLVEAQKVGVVLHADPQVAHTVNIEPLTPEDWEIIELHANFLETHLISQVRALPNPTHTSSSSSQAHSVHPLTLHLSPTSTANVMVKSLDPPLPSTSAFAKLSPEAEVIVAPKSRVHKQLADQSAGRSVTGGSQRSAGGRSSASRRAHRTETSRKPMFLRGLAYDAIEHYADEDELEKPDGSLQVWVDAELLASKNLRGTEYACVSVVLPVGAQAPVDPQQLQKLRDQEGGEAGKHAPRVIARLKAWEDAIDTDHVLVSSSLCSALGAANMVGGILRIEAAPSPNSASEVPILKVFPVASSGNRQKEGLKFGGETNASKVAAAERLRSLFDSKDGNGLLNGPVTNGMILPSTIESRLTGWHGGLVRFQLSKSATEASKASAHKVYTKWLSGAESRSIEVQQEISDPFELRRNASIEDDAIPTDLPTLVGIEPLTKELTKHLLHQSCVLLNGGLGSGKTRIAQLLAYTLRREHFYYTSYLNCRKLVADEVRVSTVKESMERLFLKASWGCKFGGRSLVILDDLDKLCPADTELQTNGQARDRQLSELLVSIVHQFCSPESGIVLLATAKSKDELHAVVVGGHVFRETVDIKAPDKDKRRKIFESLTGYNNAPTPSIPTFSTPNHSRHSSASGWMDNSAPNSPQGSSAQDGMVVDRSIDFLDVAGQTDGYMPDDLVLLCSRARGEALTRAVSDPNASSVIDLKREDFDKALTGFTPASLRNVTLQTSSTKFDSIGGLKETRKILLETLQYPTTYAPIFAQCPLRLRSGLLLYGYPGCGKTLLASAVAGECGLNFISVKGPEILNKYIGASEKSVRDLFDRAEAARPCVLFFDEFDSIAPKRGHDSTGVTDRVVNQLLTQMDGAEGLSGVYVLAATSRPDLIDPALLRPGRLDKSLICDMPNASDRLDILLALSKTLKINSSIVSDEPTSRTLHEIARRTEVYSGADLQAVVYNAHLEAIHDVLGDGKGTAKGVNETKPSRKPSSGSKQDFIQFRYGEEEDSRAAAERAASGFNRAQQAAERASLAAKVEALKVAKRKERALRRGGAGTDVGGKGARGGAGEAEKTPEAVIEWKHLEASLASTRSSISTAERRKLEGIYREFVVGRNGEMPNGQGSVEVGARSSLM